MVRKYQLHSILMAVFVSLISWTSATAQNNRSAVSITGLDTATCTVPDPCRTFDVAMSRTNAGSEIIVLSSGGYGPFTVAQSVAIISPLGIHAALPPSSGNGVTVNALSTDVVILRGLYINGLGGSSGIVINSGGSVHLENLVVSGFTINVVEATAAGANIFVKDTISRENGNRGFHFNGTGGTAIRATLDNVRTEHNGGVGIAASTESRVTVNRSVAAGNGASGFASTATVNSVLAVDNSLAAHNLTGISSNGTVRVSATMITQNTTGVSGTVISFGNNRLAGNTTEGTFSSTVPLQ